MKKFLSILLALAVGFTFTFGSAMSAFAAADTTTVTTAIVDDDNYDYTAVAKIIADQADALEANVDTDKATALKDKVSGGTVESTTIDYAAYVSVYDDMAKIAKETDIAALEQNAMVELNKEFAGKDGTYTITGEAIKTKIIKDMTYSISFGNDKVATGTKTTTNEKLIIAQLAIEIANGQAKIDKVNLNDYSTEANADNNYESNYTKVENAKKTATKVLSDNAYDKDADVSNTESTLSAKVAAKIASVKTAVETFKTTVAGINTISKDGYETADLAAIKADAIAKYTASVNAAKADAIAKQNARITANNRILADSSKTAAEKAAAQTAIDDANKNIEAINEEYPALIEVMTANINNATSAATLTDSYNAATGAYTLKAAYTTVDKTTLELDLEVAGAKSAYAKDLKAQAELAKASLNIEGSNSFNAASIEENLADTLKAMYAAVVTKTGEKYAVTGKCSLECNHATALEALAASFKLAASTDAQVLAAFIAECKTGGNDSKVLIDNKYYAAVSAWTTVTYDTDVADTITALKKATNEALDKASTIAEATSIFMDAFNKWDAIPTDSEHAALYAKTGALYEAATNYDAQIKAALAAKWQLVKKADYNADKASKLEANLIAEMHKANTAEELTANYTKVKEIIDTLKTDKDLKAEFDALNARVMAVQTPVTIAAKEEVLAVKKAYADLDEYITLIDGNNTYTSYATLNDQYVNAVKALDEKAITDAITAIGTVDLADKAAVKDLRAAYDKYVEDYDLTNETTYKAKVAAVEALLSKAMVDDVKAQLAKLATDGSNKEAVAAARAAYDELTAAEKAQISQAYYDKLIAAEKAIEAANKFTDADAKAYVFDQTIKATSVKLSAKKVKVTANFDASKLVENGYTVEYKFYKSTKKSSGYKYTGVTKVEDAKTYTNTNAKKGKNYYKFKVVVKNADGTVILTTALKDCKYALRTIK